MPALFETVLMWLHLNRWLVLGTVAAVILLTIGIAALVRRRPAKVDTKPGVPLLDKVMTFMAAGVATGVVGTGMWKFFEDLGVDNLVLRGALFAFLEIAMLAEALRSRRFRLAVAEQQAQDDKDAAENPGRKPVNDDTDPVDADGIAVWALALLSGGLAASHETDPGNIAFRLGAPIIAAWLWERGIAGELRQFRRRKRRRINWTISPERILARIGLAEASGREIGEVDRARRIARFARTAYRLNELEKAGVSDVRLAWAKWRMRREVETINEHLGLATDRSVMVAVQRHLATLYQAQEGVKPAAVHGLSPWALDTIEGQVVDTPTGQLPATMSDTRPAITSDTVSDIGDHLAVDIRSGHLSTRPSDTMSRPVSDTVTGHPSDTRTGHPTDTMTDGRPDTMSATRPDTVTDTESDTATGHPARPRRTVRRTSDRTPKWTSAQLKAFKMRDEDGARLSEIAAKLRVSEKTIGRWLKARDEAEEALRLSTIAVDNLTTLPPVRPPVTSGINGHHHKPSTQEDPS